jgi:hypothetical protein
MFLQFVQLYTSPNTANGQINKHKMDVTCSTHVKEEKRIQNIYLKTWEKMTCKT